VIDIINSFAPDKKIYLGYNASKALPKDILIYSLDNGNQSNNYNAKILVLYSQSAQQNWQINGAQFLTLIDCTFPDLIGPNLNTESSVRRPFATFGQPFALQSTSIKPTQATERNPIF
jgi:hypothetical protein